MVALVALLPNLFVAPVLIPKPKMLLLDYNRPVEVTGAWTFPAAKPKFFDVFIQGLSHRYQGTWTGGKGLAMVFDGGIIDKQLPDGYYKIQIQNNQVSVFGQGSAGLRNGMMKLAQLATVSNSKLVLPTGEVTDTPSRDFRGVHLQVGPEALGFHKKLWSNVLRPMQFNYVLLDVSRVRWATLGTDAPKDGMSVEDLRALVKFYRSIEVEPIPLIPSFSYVSWLPKTPKYEALKVSDTLLDPRKPEAEAFLDALWAEANEIFRSKTLHFGGDSLGEGASYELATQLWKGSMPVFDRIRKKQKAQMMLWGDLALGPGEAVDSTLADSLLEARTRRDSIPKGALIADRHYKADTGHSQFLTSLQLWKTASLSPIATAWQSPENIKGFYTAADVERAGTLITTWGMTDSSETQMRKNQKQFDAMILAGDYSWSARTEYLNELPYDPAKVFQEWFNPSPIPVK